mmetsp:Transcript_29884/g.68891  ORF Transcript_29884/g.68891 Transcript_29884/m.68891 type:complete len:288 (-) Transcript_29884:417-1280(-)
MVCITRPCATSTASGDPFMTTGRIGPSPKSRKVAMASSFCTEMKALDCSVILLILDPLAPMNCPTLSLGNHTVMFICGALSWAGGCASLACAGGIIHGAAARGGGGGFFGACGTGGGLAGPRLECKGNAVCAPAAREASACEATGGCGYLCGGSCGTIRPGCCCASPKIARLFGPTFAIWPLVTLCISMSSCSCFSITIWLAPAIESYSPLMVHIRKTEPGGISSALQKPTNAWVCLVISLIFAPFGPMIGPTISLLTRSRIRGLSCACPAACKAAWSCERIATWPS